MTSDSLMPECILYVYVCILYIYVCVCILYIIYICMNTHTPSNLYTPLHTQKKVHDRIREREREERERRESERERERRTETERRRKTEREGGSDLTLCLHNEVQPHGPHALQ